MHTLMKSGLWPERLHLSQAFVTSMLATPRSEQQGLGVLREAPLITQPLGPHESFPQGEISVIRFTQWDSHCDWGAGFLVLCSVTSHLHSSLNLHKWLVVATGLSQCHSRQSPGEEGAIGQPFPRAVRGRDSQELRHGCLKVAALQTRELPARGWDRDRAGAAHLLTGREE